MVTGRPDTIETARLRLRPPTPSDAAWWVALHRDPRLWTHAPHAMPADDGVAEVQFERVLAEWVETGWHYMVAQDATSGERVGVGGLRRRGEALNLYYRFAHEVHGRGLGAEAARAWTAYGLEWLPTQLRIEAAVKEHNRASVAAAERAGLERIGTRVLDDDLPDEPPSAVFAAPGVDRVDRLDDDLRAQVLDLWCRVNDADGAVGFRPGAPRAAVDNALAAHEQTMAQGRSFVVTLRSAGGELRGVGWLTRSANPLLGHWLQISRVMTDPTRRGRNLGRLLMAGVHRQARAAGAELVSLDYRGGTGLGAFYRTCGYAETGRLPRAIRLAPGDDRDSVTMARRLDDLPLSAGR